METIKLYDKQFSLLYSYDEIKARIRTLAKILNFTTTDKQVIFLPVLNGSFMFAAELLKNIYFPCEIQFIKAQSYIGTESKNLTIDNIESLNLKDKTVIILEDIVDSGNTIEKIYELIQQKEPKNIQVLSLFYKPDACKKNIIVDYSCFSITNEFIIGFGLDYNQLGRNLKNIYQEC